MDFVKDHEELYDKTNEHFKDKARKKCLRESFAKSRLACDWTPQYSLQLQAPA